MNKFDSFTQMMMITKISLFILTSDFLASINAVLLQYNVIYDDLKMISTAETTRSKCDRLCND